MYLPEDPDLAAEQLQRLDMLFAYNALKPSEQAKKQAQNNLDNFLKKFQEKGVQIFQNDVKIETTDSICIAQGTIYLIEKAGKRVDTEIEEEQKEGTPTE